MLTTPSPFLDYKISSDSLMKTIVRSLRVLPFAQKKDLVDRRTEIRGSYHNFFTKRELRMYVSSLFEILECRYIQSALPDLVPFFVEKIVGKGISGNVSRNIKTPTRSESFELPLIRLSLQTILVNKIPFWGRTILCVARKR